MPVYLWGSAIMLALCLALVFLLPSEIAPRRAAVAIYFDNSALTAGTVQAADKDLKGATMGLHSMCGYAGGLIGPLGVGLALDAAGDNTVLGWGLGFGHLAVITLIGLLVLRRLGLTAPQPIAAAAE